MPNQAPKQETILATNSLSRHFGGLKAVENVDLAVSAGEIVSIIGPNGAGKTTLFNCLTGIYPLTHGTVQFDGQDITNRKPHQITKLGIARTFQNVRLFGEMSTIENVMVGSFCRTTAGVTASMLQTSRARDEDRHTAAAAMELLQFVDLADQAEVWARNLPYGQQRRLEIARALATRPSLLLLDEPAAGMNPQEVSAMMDLIRRIRSRGKTIILIEHHMKVVMNISDRIVVLDHGEKIAEGTPDQVSADPRVIEAYLGHPYAAPA